jgi:hypothetical protein
MGRVLAACIIGFLVMILGLVAGVPLVSKWTDASLEYQRWLLLRNPIQRESNVLEHVRIVGFDDQTSFAALAALDPERAAGVSDEHERRVTRRAVYGLFLERIAESGATPKVIAFDLAFPARPGSEPFDRVLAEGVDALRQRGVPVVVGIEDWPRGALGDSHLCAALRGRVMYGGVTMDSRQGELAWLVHAALKPSGGSQVLPGLSLAAFSLSLAPGWIPTISIMWSAGVIELHYDRTLENPLATVNGGPEAIAVRVSRGDTLASAIAGTQSGDRIMSIEIDLPSAGDLAAVTVLLQQAARASDEELKSLFDDKAVVIGNMRSDAGDRFQYPDRGEQFGCVAHAVAIGSMMNGPYSKTPTPALLTWLLFAGGASGALAVLLADRAWRRALLVFCVLAMWGSAILACYHGQGLVIDPWLQGLAVLAGALLSWLIAGQVRAVIMLKGRLV